MLVLHSQTNQQQQPLNDNKPRLGYADLPTHPHWVSDTHILGYHPLTRMNGEYHPHFCQKYHVLTSLEDSY